MIYHLTETDSTNTTMARMLAENPALGHGTLIYADYQTGGRGQRGNVWSSQRGENLLFSILLCPEALPVTLVFRLSQLVSLALIEVLREYRITAMVKWPNDIYVGDSKLAGILIENGFAGNMISHSIVGVGLNVNQLFHDEIAGIHPISMRRITGIQYDREELLQRFVGRIIEAVETYTPDDDNALSMRYKQYLYRGDGYYPYLDVLRNEPISAAVVDVEPDGRLVLCTDTGEKRTYYFKEIRIL